MTEIEQRTVNPSSVVPGRPNPVDMVRRVKAEAKQTLQPDLDLAKKLVVENYNAHRTGKKGRKLTENTVYVVSHSSTEIRWTVVVRSTINRSIYWVVTRNETTKTISIEVLSKIATSTVNIDNLDVTT
jgi:hypothetical protein